MRNLAWSKLMLLEDEVDEVEMMLNEIERCRRGGPWRCAEIDAAALYVDRCMS